MRKFVAYNLRMSHTKKPESTRLPKHVYGRRQKNGAIFYYWSATDKGKKREIALGSNFKEATEKGIELNEMAGLSGFRNRTGISGATAKDLFVKVKKGAKARGFDNLLTVEDIETMLEDSNGQCSLTGIRFNANWDTAKRIRPFYPSIDRINPDLGYTKENCRVVAACVNIALNNFGDDILHKIADGLVRTRRDKLRSATN